VLRALNRIGWTLKRQSGSHRVLARVGWDDYVFAFHDGAEIGPRMLARIAKHTGLLGGSLTAFLGWRRAAFAASSAWLREPQMRAPLP